MNASEQRCKLARLPRLHPDGRAPRKLDPDLVEAAGISTAIAAPQCPHIPIRAPCPRHWQWALPPFAPLQALQATQHTSAGQIWSKGHTFDTSALKICAQGNSEQILTDIAKVLWAQQVHH